MLPSNPDLCIASLTQILSTCFGKHAPLIHKTVSSGPHCLWFNADLLSSKRETVPAKRRFCKDLSRRYDTTTSSLAYLAYAKLPRSFEFPQMKTIL